MQITTIKLIKQKYRSFRRSRRILSVTDLRRSARKPWRTLNSTYYAALAKTVQFASLPSQLQVQAIPAANPTGASTKAGTIHRIYSQFSLMLTHFALFTIFVQFAGEAVPLTGSKSPDLDSPAKMDDQESVSRTPTPLQSPPSNESISKSATAAVSPPSPASINGK